VQNELLYTSVQLIEPAPLRTITHYTRKAGVSSLEHVTGGTVPFKALNLGALVKRSKDDDAGCSPVDEADGLHMVRILLQRRGP